MIGLLDCDITGYPNLALMKLSAYYKAKGEKVGFITPSKISDYSKILVSKVFLYAKHEMQEKIASMANVEYGGTGYDIKTVLPQEIEHIMPDYDLYNAKASQGFTTRGCIRKCGFCIVPEKEGDIKAHADIDEFYDKRFKDIIFMDNNTLAHPHGIEMIKKAGKYNLYVSYNQGLDFRLLTDEICQILKNTRKHNYVFAFDDIKYKKNFIEKINILKKYDKSSASVYVLSSKNEIRECFERCIILKKMGYLPSIQILRDLKTGEFHSSRLLLAIKQWTFRGRIFACKFIDDLKRRYPDMVKMYNKYQLGDFENV